jgi:hypothetical protein
MRLRSSEHCRQLQHWLSKHAGVVASLISAPDVLASCDPDEWATWNPLQLPVQKLVQLRHLHLSWVKVQSAEGVSTGSSAGGSASSNSSAAAGLPQLQELGLNHVQLPMQLLSQLLSATGLTQLYWRGVSLHETSLTGQPLPQGQVMSTLWQHLQLLPKLTELQLRGGSLTAAENTPLSTMQHLRHLAFHLEYGRRISPYMCHTVAKAVLSALQPLTQLQHLELGSCMLYRVMPRYGTEQPGDSYQCLSALTASTQLTALDLQGGRTVPLPQAAFEHMFPTGRVLPKLKVLRLSGHHSCALLCVDSAQVARIAAGCPALQEVWLAGVTRPSFDTSCLWQLPPRVTQVQGLYWSRSTH